MNISKPTKGRAEAMMRAVERSDGGRGSALTADTFTKLGQDQFRKVVLNACVWFDGSPTFQGGIESKLAPGQIDQNLDPKK